MHALTPASNPGYGNWSAYSSFTTITANKFSNGQYVAVFGTGGLGLNLRSCANTSCSLVVNMPEGTVMQVTGGPSQSNGYIWWNLSGTIAGTGYSGWAVQDYYAQGEKMRYGLRTPGVNLTIVAKLADGAQLGRRDRWVYRRQTTLRRDQEQARYRVAVKVLLGYDDENFPAMAKSAKLSGQLDGFEISVEDGVLRAILPIGPEIAKLWRRARQGDTAYQLTHFTLPNYWRLGSEDPDGTTTVELCVSRWTHVGAKQVPAWVVNER